MREKGQTEVTKTLETPVFSRGIEILTEKVQFRLTKANHLHGSATGEPFSDHFAPGNFGSADERAGFPRDWRFRVLRRLFLSLSGPPSKKPDRCGSVPRPSPFLPWYNGKIGFSP